MTSWLILTTKPSAEHRARAQIAQQGYEPWLPLTGLLRKCHFGRDNEPEPLWPGYIWAGVSPEQPMAPLYSTIGVRRPLMAGDGPKLISDAGMARIRGFAEQIIGHLGEITQSGRMLMLGQILRVVEGPLEGKTGLCITDEGGVSVTIGVEILGRTTSVSLPVAAVRVANGGA